MYMCICLCISMCMFTYMCMYLYMCVLLFNKFTRCYYNILNYLHIYLAICLKVIRSYLLFVLCFQTVPLLVWLNTISTSSVTVQLKLHQYE